MPAELYVIYWDASALLSFLFKDSHSGEARTWGEATGVHLISSLAWAEVCAVIARMRKEHIVTEQHVQDAFRTLQQGPWSRMSGLPEWDITQRLCHRSSLRGADLWHLSAAKSLQKELPELILLTFDGKLKQAAHDEGLGLQ
ncbi:MAG: type II toxin-antitoxin system VapC family toxin [Desulfohalobiaceae bacterium]|nr:type II toxin-antitoxin system VapC family toxin [Desulfohalobiaceae bacterium]